MWCGWGPHLGVLPRLLGCLYLARLSLSFSQVHIRNNGVHHPSHLTNCCCYDDPRLVKCEDSELGA